MAQVWDQLSQKVQDPEIKNLLAVRAYFEQQDASNIQKCFQLLGKPAPPPNTQFYDTLTNNVRNTFDAIESPGLKALYALKEIRSAHNWAIGEYAALTAMAVAVGNWAVAALLEHNLADKVDFIDRRRDMIRERLAEGLAGRMAARTA
jgi:ferritin-like metal-binding protein YciE